MTKLHIGQHVHVVDLNFDGRIKEFIGDNWALIKPDAGGWPKCTMVNQILALDDQSDQHDAA